MSQILKFLPKGSYDAATVNLGGPNAPSASNAFVTASEITGFVSSNLGSANQVLAGPRTVTMAGNAMTFDSTGGVWTAQFADAPNTGSIKLGVIAGAALAFNSHLIKVASAGVTITSSVAGAVYTADYSTGFVPESLITKRYVDAQIALSSGSLYTASGTVPDLTVATMAGTTGLRFKGTNTSAATTQYGWENSNASSSTTWQNDGVINHVGALVMTTGLINSYLHVTSGGSTGAFRANSNSGDAIRGTSSNGWPIRAIWSGGSSRAGLKSNGWTALWATGNPVAGTPDAHLSIVSAGNGDATNAILAKNLGGTELFRVRDDGNVGVGINPTASKFQVAGDVETSGDGNGIIVADATTSVRYRIYMDNGTLTSQLA
jgi:hypothetical protein